MTHTDHELAIAGAAFWFAALGGEPVTEAHVDTLWKLFGSAAVEVVADFMSMNGLLVVRETGEAEEVAGVDKAIAEIATAAAIRRARGAAT